MQKHPCVVKTCPVVSILPCNLMRFSYPPNRFIRLTLVFMDEKMMQGESDNKQLD